MSNDLVVEGEDSAPMSEVCSRTQMDAIEELQEEEEEEQEWTATAGESKADVHVELCWRGDFPVLLYGLVSEVLPTDFEEGWQGLLRVDLHTIKCTL